jgi:hypothetical protein
MRYRMSARWADLEPLIDRAPIDWSKPVQFNDGTPCIAERVSGFIVITFDEDHPPAGLPIPHQDLRHFRDSMVCYEDDGAIYGFEDATLRVENVDRPAHPLDDIFATF